MRTATPHGEWLAELRGRFGPNPKAWAFKCPNCGDVANGQDFRSALLRRPATLRDGMPVTASDRLGRECIGRTLGALDKDASPYQGRGCDWAAYGLFHGPEFVVMTDGTEVPCFEIAANQQVSGVD